jgi:uncharacterized membrane protein
MTWWDHDLSTGGAIVMAIMMLVFWALLAVAIVWVVRGAAPGAPREPSARELLDRRLAHGEISPDEYRDLRAALEDRPAG